ncbi:MAG: hypothetical protein K1X95_11575 [Acidimicrobiia bacterium]|nr:hypothetical protein [Acidimicrobiia bacterium]
MPRFEPAPEDDHVGRDFEDFPELAAALGDLAKPKRLTPDPDDEDALGSGRPTPAEVEARLDADPPPPNAGEVSR